MSTSLEDARTPATKADLRIAIAEAKTELITYGAVVLYVVICAVLIVAVLVRVARP